MAKRRWLFPTLVQADRFLLNQIPSLLLQNTREFQHLWERPQEDTKDNAATAVTHSRESGLMVWLHTLWSHRYTQWTFTREPPPSNESIAGINPTVLLLNDLDELLRESATLEGYDQVSPWVLSPGLSLPLLVINIRKLNA